MHVALRVEISVESAARLGRHIGVRAATEERGFGTRSANRSRADATEHEPRALDHSALDEALGGEANQRIVTLTAGQLREV